jgi:25S rRNA (uracil2634-N3)-methyltransferase
MPVSVQQATPNRTHVADILTPPVSGAGIKDQDRNILTNQHLLLTFFRSAAPFLTEGPSRFAINKNAKVKGRPNTLRKLGAEGVQDEEDEDMAELEGTVVEGEDAAGSDAGPQAVEEDDIGIDIDEYLAQNSKVEDLNAKPAPVAEEETDPSAPPRTQGTILVTLKDSIPYTLWNLKALATRPADTLVTHPSFAALNRNKTMGGQPRYTVCRSFAFVPDLYPGYAHVKTRGVTAPNKRDVDDVIARGTGGTRTWEFALKAWERRGGRDYRGRHRRP